MTDEAEPGKNGRELWGLARLTPQAEGPLYGITPVVVASPALIALATLALLFVTRLNPAWLVTGGGAVGLASQYLLG